MHLGHACRPLRHPFALLALIALLAGCGGSSGDGDAGTPDQPAEPQAGEPFTVGETVYVNTLLGYGEVRAQASYPAYNRSEAAGGDILWGTDLGLPVTLAQAGPQGEDVTLYLFGDTDQLDLQWLADTGQVRKHRPAPDEEFVGPMGPFEADAIGWSTDANPADGVHLSKVYRNRETGDAAPVCDIVPDIGFRPVYLQGVHASPCVQVLPNTTPTGAWAVNASIFMLAGIQDPDNPQEARSYLAVSQDQGRNWTVVNDGAPFSQGGPTARFIHGFGLAVDAAHYQDPQRSGPCRLPLPGGGDTRGMLIFGAGLWKGSDVYLAFVSRADLLAAAQDPTHRLSPWYFAGTDFTAPGGGQCWSRSEADAEAIVAASDLSAYARFEDACGGQVVSGGIGYTQVVHVDETLQDGTRIDRLVMLLSPAYQGQDDQGAFFDADLGTVLITGDPLRPWVWNLKVNPASHDGTLPAERQFRPLPVAADPTHGLQPNRPHCTRSGIPWATVAGYAPLLIDRYTRLSDDGMGVDLYFNISRWDVPKGPNDDGPQRVDAYHYVVEVMRTTLRPAR